MAELKIVMFETEKNYTIDEMIGCIRNNLSIDNAKLSMNADIAYMAAALMDKHIVPFVDAIVRACRCKYFEDKLAQEKPLDQVCLDPRYLIPKAKTVKDKDFGFQTIEVVPVSEKVDLFLLENYSIKRHQKSVMNDAAWRSSVKALNSLLSQSATDSLRESANDKVIFGVSNTKLMDGLKETMFKIFGGDIRPKACDREFLKMAYTMKDRRMDRCIRTQKDQALLDTLMDIQRTLLERKAKADISAFYNVASK